MDRVSLVETIRQRVRLRLEGLKLPQSTCPYSAGDLIRMNLEILQGAAGWDTIDQCYQLLISDPTSSPNWHPEYAVPFAPSVPLLIASMCDTWRRLVLPYQNITFGILRLANMDVQEGLEFLWREFSRVQHCPQCCDPFFAEVPGRIPVRVLGFVIRAVLVVY